MVVLVLRDVLMIHGCVQMNQRCCKHSDQETPTEYCYASSSHKPESLLELAPCINSPCSCGDPLEPLTMHHKGRYEAAFRGLSGRPEELLPRGTQLGNPGTEGTTEVLRPIISRVLRLMMVLKTSVRAPRSRSLIHQTLPVAAPTAGSIASLGAIGTASIWLRRTILTPQTG